MRGGGTPINFRDTVLEICKMSKVILNVGFFLLVTKLVIKTLLKIKFVKLIKQV